STSPTATVISASFRRFGRSYHRSIVKLLPVLGPEKLLPLLSRAEYSEWTVSLPVGGVTMPPEACCTATLTEVILTGHARSKSLSFAVSFRRTLAENVAFQSYTRISSGSLLRATR